MKSINYDLQFVFIVYAAIMEKISIVAGNTSAAIPKEVSYLYDTYVTSLYWATATATSTGYGDITAQTVFEKMLSILAMMVGRYHVFLDTLFYC